MPVQDASACQACGANENLIQCGTCKDRLAQGFAIGVCLNCRSDLRKMEAVGKVQAGGSADAPTLRCNLCIVHERQVQEELLVRTVGGPTPTDLLRPIANSHKWFLTLSRATPERTIFCSSQAQAADGFYHSGEGAR